MTITPPVVALIAGVCAGVLLLCAAAAVQYASAMMKMQKEPLKGI